MSEFKTVDCVGVQVIDRIEIECPECGCEIEIPFDEFVRTAGEPWGGEHKGHRMACPDCEAHFILGDFELD